MNRVLLIILLIYSLNLRAQDVQGYNGIDDVYGYMTTESADNGVNGDRSVGLSSNYARNPLVERSLNKEFPNNYLIENLSTFNIQSNFTLLEWLSFRVSLPYGFSSGTKTARGLMGQKLNVLDDGSGLNNLSLSLKFSAFKPKNNKGFGLALVIPQSIPMKNSSKETNQSFFSTSAKIVLEYQTGSFRMAANLGYRYRFNSMSGDPRIIQGCSITDNHVCGNPFYLGNAFLYNLAFSYRLNKQFDFILDVYGRYFYSESISPLEWLIATRMNNDDGLFLTIGGGQGIGSSMSTSSFRFVFSLNYVMNANKDSDKDGITDDRDMCRDEKEDIDQYLDSDGCPDYDNDNDSVLDTADKCPLQAEDLDGFNDSDGCLDIDNDSDGIIDTRDSCPIHAEDIDKFQDNDGCPDDNELSSNVFMMKGQLFAKGNFYFEKHKASLVFPQSDEIIDNITDAIAKNPKIKKIQIESHIDTQDSETDALELTQSRAEAIKDRLISRGVPSDKMIAKGFGSSQPIADNSDNDKRKFNRRVVLRVVEMD